MLKKSLIIGVNLIVILAIGVMVMIFMIPGPKANHPTGDEWLLDTPVAHRGLHTSDKTVPENSMAAFQQAVELNFAIELDVMLSADGEVVVHHDYSLRRMTGVDANVSELTWPEIEKLKLLQSDEGIPKFSDVLNLVNGQVPILIEIKNEGAVGELEGKVLEALDGYEGPYAVQAFNPFVIGYFKEHAPDIPRGILSWSFRGEDLPWYKKFLLRYLFLYNIGQPQFVSYQFEDMPTWMANRLKEKDIYLLAWTIRSEQDEQQAAELFDNIIFDYIYAE